MTRIDTELVRGPWDWTEDHKEIARLGRYLTECGDLRTLEDCWHFVEKVKRGGWQEAYEAMLREEEMDRLIEEADAFEREGRYS